MSSIGNRLKAERERLGITQAALAEKLGVSRMTQVNYESGKRSPDSRYWEAAEACGIDVNYAITGVRDAEEWADARAFKEILLTLENLLGLDSSGLERLVKLAQANEQALNDGTLAVDRKPYVFAVQEWLKTASKADMCIDQVLLQDVLTKLEEYPIQLSAEKKAKATLLLYRAFKTTGKVDAYMIESVLSLAK